ncbi:Hsp70 family protein [Bacillus infantis]|uniref:Hsp70 family protein n=1 Tax=Bacillus infantis TaxID=324767 RepID=UPI00344E623D
MEHIVGIDFGTTNTVATIITPAGPKVILDHEGNRLTPSVVAKAHGNLQVGHDAKQNALAFGNDNGIKEIKREIGSNKTVLFAGERLKPLEIAAMILKKVKRNVEINLGDHVKKAVITVPAEFSDQQRHEIMEAGKIAGFHVEKIINEPTAAIMSYVYRQKIRQGTVLCYDFGGGTFDVSVADIHDGNIVVRCVGGDRRLGGSDIDKTMLDKIKHELESVKGCRLSKTGIYELSLAVEKTKIHLSNNETASINSRFTTITGEKVQYFKKVDRETFESWIEHHINKTIQIVVDLLDEYNINPQQHIDTVLLVGGSSQIPLVNKKLYLLFGKASTTGKVYTDESVSIGAAIEANNKINKGKTIGPGITQDVAPFTIGLKVGIDGNSDVFDPVIRKNFPYNQEYSEIYDTAIDYQKTMLLQIYQGEDPTATENEHICDFEIEGIPEREAGKESVKVSFIYDDNGIIHINATILSTGRRLNKEVTYKRKLSYSQTSQSKEKVKKHFNTTDQQFEDALTLNKSLKTYAMSEESKKLEAALKKDDLNEIKKMEAALFD